MEKWADFVISQVNYDSKHLISNVKRHKDSKNGIEYGEIIDVKSKVDTCRDKEDNFLLALAKDGKADYLITGDKDLLVIESFGKTKITNVTDFLKIHH